MSKAYDFGDVQPQFVLSYQDGVSVGHYVLSNRKQLLFAALLGVFLNTVLSDAFNKVG